MAQGFVAAQDRLFNMELLRLVAAGRAYTLSENKKTYYKAAEPSGPMAEGRISLIHSNG